MSIDVFLELNADLALRRLILDERMFQQLLSAWSHCVVFDETHLDKVVKLLRPVTPTRTIQQLLTTRSTRYSSIMWNSLA